MAEPENADRLIDVLKEIRDELRAVRIELGAGGGRMTSAVRTERMDRGGRWRIPALAAGGVGLALVIGLALRDRPVPPAMVAAAPQSSAPRLETPARSETPASVSMTLAMPPRAVSPAPAPVAAHVAAPIARAPAAVPAPPTKSGERLPAATPAVAAVPAPTKSRLHAEVAAGPPAEVVSDADETIAFPPPPRRVRVHRLSYGPVGSEPAKL